MNPSRQSDESLLFIGLYNLAYHGLSVAQHRTIDFVEVQQIVMKTCGVSTHWVYTGPVHPVFPLIPDGVSQSRQVDSQR